MRIDEAIIILKEAIQCGPARYNQLEPDIRDIYREFEFDLQKDKPADVLQKLTTNYK